MTDPSPPHRHIGGSVRAVMLRVGLALLPGIVVYAALFGIGILVQCALAIAFALCLEAAALRLRRRPVGLHLGDGSVIITALLFALCISPLTPWWVNLIGVAFAVILAKHAFGGIGHNLFNPAMAGYVFVLLCFPARMNVWPVAPGTAGFETSAKDMLAAVFATGNNGVDALSGATALAHMKSQLGLMQMVSEIRAGPLYGHFGGVGWEWLGLAFLAGGVALLAMGVIRWHIPAAMLAAMAAISTVFYLYDADVYASPVYHLSSGGTLLGAFFIATDPVTAATSARGRLVFGAFIGVLSYVIRVWGSFPDGIAFAVLMANASAPLIDHYTRPRVLGESPDGT